MRVTAASNRLLKIDDITVSDVRSDEAIEVTVRPRHRQLVLKLRAQLRLDRPLLSQHVGEISVLSRR
jgi:hypothetical protein